MNGTSAAAPMVSGVIALMLDANPDLGWRDVQEILALTAFHTGSEIGSGPGLNEDHTWYFNGAGNWNGGGMHYSEDYGYGNVDVFGAVRMAEAYAIIDAAPKTSANEVQNATEVMVVDLEPVDGDPGDPVTFDFTFSSDMVIQHVELTINYDYEFMSDLAIVLTSPDGTDVQVQTPNFDTAASLSDQSWVYGIEALHGEASAGTWTVSFADSFIGGTGTINSIQMTVYGTTPVSNDVYHYTDEFEAMLALDSSRADLGDTNGGVDWIDMAAVSTSLTLNLSAGLASSNGLVIAAGSVIENAIAGDGNDTINGNGAANFLYGMRGNDTLSGGDGNDTLEGGAGNDALNGGDDSDTASYADAGGGVSVALSSAGAQNTGGAGTDTLSLIENLIGSTFVDTLSGTSGVNTLSGLAGNDTLTGFGGNDRLDGGADADAMSGGNGDDTYVVDNAGDTASEAAGSGTDLVQSAVTFSLGTGIENLTLTGTAAINGTGNASANAITGNSATNTLSGLAGNDTLTGFGGNDRLDGGTNADTMVGGNGNDTYVVDNAGDTASEASGSGMDTVQSAVTFTLGTGIENLTLTGATAINGTGNPSVNAITGNSAANTLSGLAGNDTLTGFGGNDRLDGGTNADAMSGGNGDDTYVVDNVGDTASEASGSGTDTVSSTVTFTLAAGIETLVLNGTAAIDGAGNTSANTLFGNSAANRLDGNGGADTIRGFGGADVFVFDDGDGADTVTDFQNGVDRCDLTQVAGVDEFSDLVLTDTGAGVDVDYGTGSFELASIANPVAIDATDFVFA